MRVPPASVYFPPEDRAAILQQIDECLATGQLTLGKLGRQLEERFAAYVGADHAVAVNSGTSAIEIPLRAMGVEGKEVLVAANSFFATAAAAIAAGASIRFVDCDPRTMAVDPASLRSAIGPNTAGVIVVHIGGLVTPDIAELRKICDDEGVWLFEDAAHAHGSAHDGQMAGTFGVAGSFSFYPTKVMAGGVIAPTDVATLPDGRLVVAHGLDRRRIVLVYAAGTITALAGGGRTRMRGCGPWRARNVDIEGSLRLSAGPGGVVVAAIVPVVLDGEMLRPGPRRVRVRRRGRAAYPDGREARTARSWLIPTTSPSAGRGAPGGGRRAARRRARRGRGTLRRRLRARDAAHCPVGLRAGRRHRAGPGDRGAATPRTPRGEGVCRRPAGSSTVALPRLRPGVYEAAAARADGRRPDRDAPPARARRHPVPPGSRGRSSAAPSSRASSCSKRSSTAVGGPGRARSVLLTPRPLRRQQDGQDPERRKVRLRRDGVIVVDHRRGHTAFEP